MRYCLACNIHYGPENVQPGLRMVYFQSNGDASVQVPDNIDESYFTHEWAVAEHLGTEQQYAKSLIDSGGEYRDLIINPNDRKKMDDLVKQYTIVAPPKKKIITRSLTKSLSSSSRSSSSSSGSSSRSSRSSSSKDTAPTTRSKSRKKSKSTKKKNDDESESDDDENKPAIDELDKVIVIPAPTQSPDLTTHPKVAETKKNESIIVAEVTKKTTKATLIVTVIYFCVFFLFLFFVFNLQEFFEEAFTSTSLARSTS